MNNIKAIAMYLPQYHPTKNNNLWWGKGFTEWTNVARARPLFKGHEQPHIPGELGFYDLRMPEARQAQADLAKEYGIYGFCYYYYRFSKGHNELELPLNEVLKTGKPDFPFMICWANQTWHKKFWRYDGTSENQILAEQTYGGIKDYKDFFYEVLPFFKDKRYIRIDNKPAFMIHKPKDFKDVQNFINLWQELAKKEGLNGIYFIGYINGIIGDGEDIKKGYLSRMLNSLNNHVNVEEDKNIVIKKGFDAVTINRQYFAWAVRSNLKRIISYIQRKVLHLPKILHYKDAIRLMLGKEDKEENVFPTILPNWDHTPRSSYGGEVYVNGTPELWEKCLSNTIHEINNKDSEHQIIFIKAWNEWGEGNYLEPDLKWGRNYLEATKEALKKADIAGGGYKCIVFYANNSRLGVAA